MEIIFKALDRKLVLTYKLISKPLSIEEDIYEQI